MKKTSLLCMLLLSTLTATAQEYSFRIKNSLGFDRVDRTAEITIPASVGLTLSQCTLSNENGEIIPFEAEGDTLVRFLANISRGTTMGYKLTMGTAGSTPEKLTYAAIKSPTNRADIAWENDRCAYRMYSSTLLASEPNTGNGVDLWVKKKSTPIIDAMYNLSNYHSESEYGVDAFSVNGRRLGVGGVSHVVNGKLIIHDPHSTCTVVRNDALRSEFIVTYPNITIDGDTYTKTVRVITTAGSLLNKAIVRYEGPEKTLKLAVALYQHTDMTSLQPHGVAYTSNEGVAGWAENSSEGTVTSTGARFYQGCYIPGDNTTTEVIDDHLCVTTDYTPGTDLVYYFGGGWSVFPDGDFSCDEDWFDALDRFKQEVEHPLCQTSWEGSLPQKDDVISALTLANDHWQQGHPTHGDHFWNRAVYHTGNMAAYEVTQDQSYLDYSQAWAEHNNYWGQTGTDSIRWKYTYGESADYVLFGDNQICFQVYADLYNLLGGEDKIARAREVMEYEMSTSFSGYLWWVDGLYMVMPVMTKLYNITKNDQYLEKMHEYWAWGTERMWDEDESLYYRDTTYVYPKHTTSSGGKDFWARGDGWIFAAFARVLDELPTDNPYRDEYIAYYRRMAESLRKCQCTDADGNGYWCRSLLEEDYAPGYETSGTALNTYGFAWGINNGILDEQTYGSTLQRAWNYLTRIALQSDGTVGYVQPIGSNAAPGTYMTASQTADFGVGAFLLAASEMSRYAAGEQSAVPLRVASVTLSGTESMAVRFNTTPAEEGLTNPENYLMNGTALDVDDEITYDGAHTVNITFARPLRYGRYTVNVQNLTSSEGTALSDNSTVVVCTVPLYANKTIETVTAIGAQSGNSEANAIDNTFDTRWSQNGTQQWIQFDLGSLQSTYAVDLAWYLGNTRVNYFDVKYSLDGEEWTDLLTSQQSSGLTNEMERYYFPETTEARYVRIYCNGASTTTWNSITEGRVCVIDESLDDLVLPSEVYADIFLPSSTDGGTALEWRSSNTSVMSNNGAICPANDEQSVTLTAYAGDQERNFTLTVMPRNVEQSLLLRYDFETTDVYTKGTTRYVTDLSGHGRDAKLMNSKSVVDGTLNLTQNSASTFSSNGYAIVPSHLLDSIRSYTILFTATPQSLESQPRFYDFGSATSNSMFLRASELAAGYKYNGGTTSLVNGGTLQTGVEQHIAVSFSAQDMTTSVYVDGTLVAQSQDIQYEPWQLTQIGTDTRNYIGRTQWWSSASKSSNVDFCGTLDDFRIYGLCLNAEEIADVFQTIATGVKAPTDSQNGQSATYDLSGRRTADNTHGLIIRNGQKMIQK